MSEQGCCDGGIVLIQHCKAAGSVVRQAGI